MNDKPPERKVENNGLIMVENENTPEVEREKEAEHNGTQDDKSDTKQTESSPDNADDSRQKGGLLFDTKLYCHENGRSHGSLWEFGLNECPLCDADLFPPAAKKGRRGSDDTASNDTAVSGKTKATRSSEDAKQQRPEVLYTIQYLDSGDKPIGNESCEGVFDVSNIRQNTGSAFEIVTVLRTSIPTEHNQEPYQADQLMRKGILNNPNVILKLATTRLTIYSATILQLLRRYVRYYPATSLDSVALQLDEPFSLIAHHYNELDTYRKAHKGREILEDGEKQNIVDEDATEMKHLEFLLGHFERIVMDDVRKEQALYAVGTCTFRMLWLLYKPGITVYFESDGHLAAYVVQSVKTDPTILSTVSTKRHKSYRVKVWSLEFDGKYVGRVDRSITIGPFEGERPITSLKLIPCEMFDREDGGKWKNTLEQNGKKWYELLPGGQVQYSGPVLDENKTQLDGRVYIDHVSYSTYSIEIRPGFPIDTTDSDSDEDIQFSSARGPVRRRIRPPGSALKSKFVRDMGGGQLSKCQCEDCRGLRPHPPHGFPWVNYDILDPTVDKDLTLPGAPEGPRHRYLLCGRLLKGFDLKSRTWVKLDVAYCKPPRPNLRAIDTLVMPSERKDMIKALIQKFTSNGPGKSHHQAWKADYIENKGDGRIFLLHGSPGVGKTYTAECIAEYTERPLLSLTVGDIGTDEVKMEQQLSKWFQLAEKWGAVMLIDEADVYLERRQVTDLKRNSLVAGRAFPLISLRLRSGSDEFSVFLRCIEYYRGVLFLTTNRVGQFDDAFISRIHVIIHYEKLTAEGRMKIWKQFFDKLDNDREDFKTTRRAKDYVLGDGEISQMEWNGREIRNAFQTAVALADYRFLQNRDSSNREQPTLDQRDFEQVCAMMQQFKSYLINVHNMDEGQRAFNAGSRAIAES
ncbi:hypothetical protein NW762_013251 [Fusarium torreyae]|uniref:AAA+ ATPase domain-containing protein n=1 Tax=Fusarium torreyae TaxID=1237075 RepID=A0A9W8RNR3_9HYPO|nr:hypothetical protein NW762_013251 [Fusarium torreyae]